MTTYTSVIQITYLVSQAVSSDLVGKGQVCGVHVPTTKPSVCIYIYCVCVFVCVCVCILKLVRLSDS